MSHRNPNINDPDLAVILAELVTEKVRDPPRGYATVEHIGLPDGSILHESSQYGFAPVVASWLKSHGYRAGQGAVAAYKALEAYLAGECAMGEAEVQAFRRRAIAQALVALTRDVKVPHAEQIHARMFHMGDRFIAGFPGEHPDTLWTIVAAGTSDIDAIARAADRLMRCGYRVGMSQATTVALLCEDSGPNWNYKPTEADKPWIADIEHRRPRHALLTEALPGRHRCLKDIERHPEPRQAFNAGVADRLLRGGLAESVELTSPYPTHKGRKIEHLQITAAGRSALVRPRRVLMGGGL